jgi:hypothetical protein
MSQSNNTTHKKRLSDNAMIILKTIYKNKNIIGLKEDLSHDGYDEFGPKSYIWDLYIVSLEHNIYIYRNYHYENWFAGDVLRYELIFERPVSMLTSNVYHFKNAANVLTTNTNYIHYVKNLI